MRIGGAAPAQTPSARGRYSTPSGTACDWQPWLANSTRAPFVSHGATLGRNPPSRAEESCPTLLPFSPWRGTLGPVIFAARPPSRLPLGPLARTRPQRGTASRATAARPLRHSTSSRPAYPQGILGHGPPPYGACTERSLALSPPCEESPWFAGESQGDSSVAGNGHTLVVQCQDVTVPNLREPHDLTCDVIFVCEC